MITAEICSQMEKCLISMTISEGWNRKKSGYHYYHLDEQNSTAYITGGSGEIENRYEYDAFGVLQNSREELPNRILYTGQQYDQTSGQYYLRARYYNPVVGRFLQEDVYRGDGLNLYAYCKNNPVVYYDPSGYDGEKCDKVGGNDSKDGNDSLSEPVEFKAPPNATPYQIQQVKDYVDGCNQALKDGALSSTGRVSTAGDLRRQASSAARSEKVRAAQANIPYSGHVGHVPDTTWTGTPQPYLWLDLDPTVNTSLGGQSTKYPVGYKPAIFIFMGD